jgi:uncharacterized membrane protein
MKNESLDVVLIIISFLLLIVFYPFIPESVALHWNYLNTPDFYASKLYLFTIPILTVFSFIVMKKLPRLKALNKEVEFTRHHYADFVSLIIIFLIYVEGVLILSNIYFSPFSLSDFLLPAFSVFLYWTGLNLNKIKRNDWIGIRTPWSVKNDHVWVNTNIEGAKLFKVLSIITMLSLFFDGYQWIIFLSSTATVAIVLILFSYFDYKSLE